MSVFNTTELNNIEHLKVLTALPSFIFYYNNISHILKSSTKAGNMPWL